MAGMKRITSEDLVLNLILNADQAEKGNKDLLNELYRLDQQVRTLETDLIGLNKRKKELKTTDANYASQLANLNKQIRDTTLSITQKRARMDELRKQIGITGMTINQLNSYLQALRIRLNNATNPAVMRSLRAEIERVSNRVERLRTGVSRLSQAWRHLGTLANKFGTLVGYLTIGMYAFSRAVGFTARNLRELDRLFSNVMKTTGMTRQQVALLKKEFDQLENTGEVKTPTTTKDLLGMARIAGRLGVRGLENIRDFTLAIDKMYVSLSTDLSGSVEDVTEKIGKLVNVFRLEKEMPLNEALLRAGSLINELGKRSAANAEAILNYTARLGGVGSMAGFTIDQLAGLGATLDANQVKAERGSTALVKLIVGLGKHAGDFSRLMGITLEQYNERLKTDVNGVLIEMLQLSASGNESVMDVVRGMDAMDVSGVRVAETYGKLTANIEMLKEQQKIAAVAFESSASVMNEFYIVAQDFDSLMAIQGKRMKSLADDYSRKVAPAMLKLYTGFINFLYALRDIGKALIRYNSLMKAAVALLILFKAQKIAEAIQMTILSIRVEIAYRSMLVKKYWEQGAAMVAMRAAYVDAGKGIKGLIAVMRSLWLTMAANPLTLIIGLVSAAAAAFFIFQKRVDAVTAAQAKLDSTIKAETAGLKFLFDATMETVEGTQKRKDLIKAINEQYGKYLPNLISEKASIEELAEARKIANAELLSEIALRIKNEELNQLQDKYQKKVEKLSKRLFSADKNIEKYPEEYARAAAEFAILQDELSAQYLENGEQFSEDMKIRIGRFANANGKFFSEIFQTGANQIKNIIVKTAEYNSELKRIYDFASNYKKEYSGLTGIDMDNTGVGGGTMTEAEFKAEADAFKYARDERKLALMQSINDEDKLKKAELKSEEQYLREMLDLTIRFNTNKEGIVISGEQDILDARIALEENLNEKIDKKKKKDIEESAKDRMNQEQAQLAMLYERKAISKSQYEAEIIRSEIEFNARMVHVAKAAGEDHLEYEKAYFDARIKLRENYTEQAKAVQEAMALAYTYYKDQKEEDDPGYSKADENSVEQMVKDRKRIRSALGLEKTEGLEEQLGVFSTDNFDAQLSVLEDFYRRKVITHAEYEQIQTDITREQTKMRMSIAKEGLSVVNDYLSSATSYYEAQKQKEIDAAGNNKKKIAAIEKTYAKKEQKIAVAQTLIKGAMAIMDLYGNNTIPEPFKQIYISMMLPLIIGNTRLQLKTIKAQQYAEGLYPVVGADDKRTYNANYVGRPRTGIYNRPSLGLFAEKPEMVIDNKTLRNIQFNSPGLIDAIMAHRGGYANRGIQGVKQYATGNYNAYTPGGNDATLIALLERNTAAMESIQNMQIWASFEEFKKVEHRQLQITETRGMGTMTKKN